MGTPERKAWTLTMLAGPAQSVTVICSSIPFVLCPASLRTTHSAISSVPDVMHAIGQTKTSHTFPCVAGVLQWFKLANVGSNTGCKIIKWYVSWFQMISSIKVLFARFWALCSSACLLIFLIFVLLVILSCWPLNLPFILGFLISLQSDHTLLIFSFPFQFFSHSPFLCIKCDLPLQARALAYVIPVSVPFHARVVRTGTETGTTCT